MNIPSIQPKELHDLMSKGSVDLIDVRTPGEYSQAHVPGAVLVPLDQLDVQKVQSARRNSNGQAVYVICQAGRRSLSACEKLVQQGMGNVVNVAGGTSAWAAAGLPVEGDEAGSGGQGKRLVRLLGFATVLAGLVLGLLVDSRFTLLAAGAWIAMTVFGGGCPLGACSVPRH